MKDTITALLNELVCRYCQIKGYCTHDCLECNLIHEDIVIINALEAAKEALEKQIPQKLNFPDYFYERCLCPRCNQWLDGELLFQVDAINYCPVCGQAIDWPEVEE